MMMRLRYRQLGGHIHCRVFTAKAPHLTFAKVGDLIFDEREWPEVRKLLRACEFIEEDRDGLAPLGGAHGAATRQL